MPSDSVTSFLEQARAQRIVRPDVFDDLFRSPEVPQENVGALCDVLQARGVLTRFQADAVRAGRGDDLTFAGYPVADELGPCPGGTAFRAVHPSLRTPLVLRRLRADWIGPADNVAAFVQRARDAAPVVHPHLAHLLDAGVHQDEAFAILDPVDGADLFALVTDIGPMPAPLAAAYTRQLAEAVAAAHDKGIVHGDVRPGVAFAGPLVPMGKLRADGTPKLRPAPAATATLCELGLVPRRPPVAAWPALGVPLTSDVAFLPPERLDDGEPTSAGDVYGLGATAYFLLTGRPPFRTDDPPRLLEKLRDAAPQPLDAFRPDAPKELVELVTAMMAKDPHARPTAAQVVARLVGARSVSEGQAGTLADASGSDLAEVPLTAAPEELAPLEPAPHEPAQGFVVDEGGWTAFPVDAPADPAKPAEPKPAAPPPDRKKLYMWIGIGLGLQLLAVAGWILFVTQPSWLTGGTPQPKPSKTSPSKKSGGRAG